MEMFTGIVPMNKENLGKITSDVKEMSNQTVTAINTKRRKQLKVSKKYLVNLQLLPLMKKLKFYKMLKKWRKNARKN